MKTINLLVIGGIIVVVAYFAFGGDLGSLGQVPFEGQLNDDTALQVSIAIEPTALRVGESVTGTINSNMPNGGCRIFMHDGTRWNFVVDVPLDNNGNFAVTRPIPTAGTGTFTALCTDETLTRFRRSNDVRVIVSP